jgi:hypothetical protein
MSSSQLFLANAAMTLGFAVGGYVAPVFTFAQFGLNLGPPEAALVRGYAAACLGYGSMMLGLKDLLPAEHVMIAASTIFNVAETLLQGHAIFANTGFSNTIWATFLGHSGLAVWSLWRLAGYKKKEEAKSA